MKLYEENCELKERVKDNQEVHHKVSDEQRNIHYWLVESVLIVVWY
jgi:hypothetical protein